MEKDRIERLRDNKPKFTKSKDFSTEKMRSAIERAYKKCGAIGNADKSYREEVNDYWWITLCERGSIPIVEFSLERWLAEPKLEHLQVFASLMYMCEYDEDDSQAALELMMQNVSESRRKKGHWIYAVTGGLTLKGY